jgi:predicted PurR-regulated permease PerM
MTERREVQISVSLRTIVLIAGAVAAAWALASIGGVLLTIFVAVFNVAVLLPVVNAMERRLGWSKSLCTSVLVLAMVIITGGVLLVMVQAIAEAVRGL